MRDTQRLRGYHEQIKGMIPTVVVHPRPDTLVIHPSERIEAILVAGIANTRKEPQNPLLSRPGPWLVLTSRCGPIAARH